MAKTKLAPVVDAIDTGELYPADVLRALGAEGAFSSHMPKDGAADLRPAIAAMSVLSEYCGATAFMAWCQDTLAWYIGNSANAALKAKLLAPVTSAQMLGGTGLSNPMKTFFGIEKMKLKGRKVDGGYIVKGALPWVSNLGPDHIFGTIFEREDAPGEKVMFLVDCSDPECHAANLPAISGDGRHRHLSRCRSATPSCRTGWCSPTAPCPSSSASAPASCCCRPAWGSA